MDNNGNQPDKKTKKQKYNIFIYAAVLFGLAFFLILLSYLVQQRNNSATISRLNESSANYEQNIESLQIENSDLTVKNTQLNEELESLTKELSDAKAQLSETKEDTSALEIKESELEKTNESLNTQLTTTQASAKSESLKAQALEYLWQLQRQFYNGNYDAGRAIIKLMEEKGYQDYLPTNSILLSEGYDVAPKHTYDTLKEILGIS